MRLAAVVLLALVAAAPARAADLRAFHRAQAVASEYFPSACSPALHFAEFDPPVAQAHVAFIGGQPECSITFQPSAWRRPWYLLCAEMVHEYGHLAGFGHVASPRSIMYAGLSVIPRRCHVAGYTFGEVVSPPVFI